MKGICSLAAAAILALVMPVLAHAAPAGGIEEIAVELEFTGDYVGPETQDRIEFALLDTLQLALVEQLEGDLDYINQHQRQVTEVIGEVISESLSKRGFVLEQLVLDPGRLTTVHITLHTAEQQVDDFSVRFHILGNSPLVDAAIRGDEDALRQKLLERLSSTPYSDTRWISGLVTEVAESYLAGLPAYDGFDKLVTVQAGQTTAVAVTLEPSAGIEVLDCYSVKFRSMTLPFLLLEDTRHSADIYLANLVGAPVSFVSAKLNPIREALYIYLVNECELVHAESDLLIRSSLSGCCMNLLINAESSSIYAAGQARLALWELDEPGYTGRVSGAYGVQVRPGIPVYGKVNYYPAAGEAFPRIAAGKVFGSEFFAAAGWDFKAEAWCFTGLGNLNPDLYFGADIYSNDDWDSLSELSLHYRLKDIYEIQLVSTFGGDVFAAVAANL